MDDDDLRPPAPLHDMAQTATCRDTVAGWLWYCDEHDSHGNADSEEEARHVAAAHADWFADDGDRCEVVVWMRTEHERG